MPFRFDPNDPAFVRDPYPTYQEMRDRHPVYRMDENGFWLITRYEDISRALGDSATYSSSRGNTTVDTPVRVGKTLGTIDPPRHDELRRIILKGFTPARIEAVLPGVREHSRKLANDLRAKGGGDLVLELGRPVLFNALGRMLGLDDAAATRASQLMTGLFHSTEGPMGSPLPGKMAPDIYALLSDELKKRKGARGDDLFSVLISAREQGANLSEDEIVANMMTVLLAGNASVGHFFPNLMHALWLHPDARKAVRENPGLIDAAIEEGVRWDTSTQCFARHLTADVEIAGIQIPAESRLVLFYGSANRDERVIANADRFDINRSRVRHFGWGSGPHFCFGAPTAKAMVRTILQEALPVLGDYELDMDKAVRVHHTMVRGFKILPARL
jgi:cytochrome P450